MAFYRLLFFAESPLTPWPANPSEYTGFSAAVRTACALDLTRPDLPSIGVSGDIWVRPEQRKAFLDELQQTLQDLFTRYGGAKGDAFRLAVACYPKGDPDDRA